MSAAKGLPREQLIEFLGEMLLIRRFEEKVTERFRAGELAGSLHAAIGQEAVAVGVCRALEDGDVIASTHRAHGHVLANGTPAKDVMAELYGARVRAGRHRPRAERRARVRVRAGAMKPQPTSGSCGPTVAAAERRKRWNA